MIEFTFLKELKLIRQANERVRYLSLLIFFKFQPNVCNRCHDLLMMSMNFSDIAILNIKSDDYRCIISAISKSEAINLMQNIDLIEKSGAL